MACRFKPSTRLVQARWTNKLLDERFARILESRDELTADKLERTRQLTNSALPDALVDGYEPLMSGLTLPDPDALPCHRAHVTRLDSHITAARIANRPRLPNSSA